MTTKDNQAALSSLMRGLDTKKRVEWLPEMGLGLVALEHLLGELRGGTLTTHQTCNGALAVFRLRGHGHSDQVWAALVRLATDDREKVRTVAATLLVGILRLGEQSGQADAVGKSLAESVRLGLEGDAARLVGDYLAGKVAPFAKGSAG